MRHKLEIKKITTIGSGIDLLNLREFEPIEVTEFGQQILVCQLPKACVAVGNLVAIRSTMYFGNEKILFDVTGVISSVGEIEFDKLERVEIKLRQFNKQIWQRFLVLAEERQAKADTLFAAIKGEGA